MLDRTRVKVCGITSPDAAVAAVESGADAIGFVFVEGTPRFIEPEHAAMIMDALPPMVSAIGVVRDLSVEAFGALEHACPAHHFQLHGSETVSVVRQCGPAIKAFRYDDATIDSQLDRWRGVDELDAILIDGGPGGSGEAFDWAALAPKLEGYPLPVFIAGGITPENVGEVVRTLRPYAIDASSGVEEAPGVKDPERIRALCDAVRAADASA